jgi:hypothetical protein
MDVGQKASKEQSQNQSNKAAQAQDKAPAKSAGMKK